MVVVQRLFIIFFIYTFFAVPVSFAQTNTADDLRITIQPLLSELGYYGGRADGVSGPKTRQAVSAFEKRTVGPDNGFLDDNEIYSLISQARAGRKNASNTVVRTSSLSATEQLAAQLEEQRKKKTDALRNNMEITISEPSSEEAAKQIDELEAENAELVERVSTAEQKQSMLLSQVNALNETLTEQAEVKRQLEDEKSENETLVETLSAEEEHSAALSTQVDALNKTLTDYVNGLALENKIVQLSAQRDAANSALVDVQQKIESDFAPKEDLLEAKAQVKALNTSLAELRVRLNTEFVPQYELQEKQATIDTLNKTLADAAGTAEAKRLRQVSALNGTIVELQEKIEILDRRKAELWTTLNSFLTDCKNSTTCAMELGLN